MKLLQVSVIVIFRLLKILNYNKIRIQRTKCNKFTTQLYKTMFENQLEFFVIISSI